MCRTWFWELSDGIEAPRCGLGVFVAYVCICKPHVYEVSSIMPPAFLRSFGRVLVGWHIGELHVHEQGGGICSGARQVPHFLLC